MSRFKETENFSVTLRVYNPAYKGKRQYGDLHAGCVCTIGWERLANLLKEHGHTQASIGPDDEIIGFSIEKEKGINIWLTKISPANVLPKRKTRKKVRAR